MIQPTAGSRKLSLVLGFACACLFAGSVGAQPFTLDLHKGLNQISVPAVSGRTLPYTAQTLLDDTGARWVARTVPVAGKSGVFEIYVTSLGNNFELLPKHGYLLAMPADAPGKELPYFAGAGSQPTTSTVNFTGTLEGDVTGTQHATVVSSVGGASAASIASGAAAAGGATATAEAGKLVKRDANGGFSAGAITATGVVAGAITATQFSGTLSGNASGFNGNLGGDVTGTQGETVVSKVGGVSADTLAGAASTVASATAQAVADTLVKRDANGAFSATTITAHTFVGTWAGTISTATEFSGSLDGDVTGTQRATVVSRVGGVPADTLAGAASTIASATAAGGPDTLVKRDSSGGFTAAAITATSLNAGTITAGAITATSLVGHVTGNISGTATSFTGPLTGDITGTQSLTWVSRVGGVGALTVAQGASAAVSATWLNQPGQLVKRDANGGFAAGAITATSFSGPLSGSASRFTEPLAGDITGTQSLTWVSKVGGVGALTVAQGASAAVSATWLNQPGQLVKRDGSGGFAAGAITASAITATSFSGPLAGNASGFTGPLTGDITGTQSITWVAKVGGVGALTVAQGSALAYTATASGVANAIVKRDAFGGFTAGPITASQVNATAITATYLSGNVTGNVSGLAAGFTGSLVGDVTGSQAATVVSSVGGKSATEVAAVVEAASLATSENTTDTIVQRDSEGSFSATTVTADLVGNVLGNVRGDVQGSAAGFLGNLQGDVTGAQEATVVSMVGGKSSTEIAEVVNAASTATSNSEPNSIVRRDDSRNFAAGIITANLIGDVQGNVSGNASGTAGGFTGSLGGDVTGTQDVTVVERVAGVPSTDVATSVAAVGQATREGYANTLVRRDASGNFAAGTITAELTGNMTGNLTGNVTGDLTGNVSGNVTGDLTGNMTGNVTGDVSGTASGFTGNLEGDVRGTQGVTQVATVGGKTATQLSQSVDALAAATPSNIQSTLVARDGSGNFAAGTVAANLQGNVTGNLTGNVTGDVTGNVNGTATGFTGNLEGDVTGAQAMTHVAFVGGKTATQIADGVEALAAATATSAPSTLVARDASGNFAAGTITANLSGNVAGNVNGHVTGNVTGDVTGNVNGTATGFTGSLNGEVTGPQANTVVALVGGKTASQVSQSVEAVGAATAAAAPSTLVARDTHGDFVAGTITATFRGDVAGNVTGNLSGNCSGTSTGFTGILGGDVTGTQGATVVGLVGGKTASQIADTVDAGIAATNANTPSTLVKRDPSGNFTAGTITAATKFVGHLEGTMSGDLTGNAVGFTGLLSGDVTGRQTSTVVGAVGGKTSSQIAQVVTKVEAAAVNNQFDALVLRDGSGNFTAGTITANLVGDVSGNATTCTNFVGNLNGDVHGGQVNTSVVSVGGRSAAEVASGAALANEATDGNTGSRIVKRNSTGGFDAGTINATLAGDVTGSLNAGGAGKTLTLPYANGGPAENGQIAEDSVSSTNALKYKTRGSAVRTLAYANNAGSGSIGEAAGLVIRQGGPTVVNLYVDRAVLYDSQNQALVVRPGVEYGINSAVNGNVNCLDTSSRTASTWYYVWLISDGTTHGGLLSASSTSPSMPSGYDFRVRLGSCRTDGSNNIIDFAQVGHQVYYANPAVDCRVLTNGNSTEPTAVNACTNFIPPSSKLGMFQAQVWVSDAAQMEVGGDGNGPLYGRVVLNASPYTATYLFSCPTTTQKIQYQAGGTSPTVTIDVVGYHEH